MSEQFKEDFDIRTDDGERPDLRVADEAKARYLADAMDAPMEAALRTRAATAGLKEAVAQLLENMEESARKEGEQRQRAEKQARYFSDKYDEEQPKWDAHYERASQRVAKLTKLGREDEPYTRIVNVEKAYTVAHADGLDWRATNHVKSQALYGDDSWSTGADAQQFEKIFQKASDAYNEEYIRNL